MDIYQQIWDFCLQNGMTEAGAAGVMGNIACESDYIANNVENRAPLSNELYTNGVDRGSYTAFVSDALGYGLCQWTYPPRKAKLLSLARERGCSIGDAAMQLDFMLMELKADYPGLLNTLRTSNDLKETSDAFMCIYENPYDRSDMAKLRRLSKSTWAISRMKNYQGITALPELYEGNTGESVRAMQQLLSLRGQRLAVDGIFGGETASALFSFQQRAGLVADEICGEKTWFKLIGGI